MEKNKILGIDIGSVYISMALMDQEKNIEKTSYFAHQGKITEKLDKELREYPLSEISHIALTTSVPDIFRVGVRYDNRVSFITAVREYFNKIGSVLIVGGEKFGLAFFDNNGNYVKYKGNTSCAAGTGSFLDQQAQRMNIPNIAEFSRLALENEGDFPRIASRCAVFAKTDIIHAQQEGYKKQEIADGLAYGLAKNLVDTLFSGSEYNEPIIFVGGVSQNQAVIKHINRLLNTKVITHPLGHLFGAIGAILNLQEDLKEKPENFPPLDIVSPEDILIYEPPKKDYYFPPLELKLSEYPDFSSLERYEYQSKQYPHTIPVETDIYEPLPQGTIKVYMGIDIGSTSTKAVVINEKKQVLIGLYTRTSGQPVIAVQTIFETLTDIEKRYNCKFEFLGVGTTGSGRKFIGKIIGADSMLDEITAHARAAYELDPEVDTIIEIGGQDSKFTTLRNGMVTFSVMNNVCAAGTGSFIEEQAKKLGVPLSEYAQRAMGVPAPLASDRCTVFMERDLNNYINKGYNTNEILAAVLHSIRENYITKVAIESNIGKKIFFQGATAKNKALVAAFEQRLQKPIMVSKYCHLTGAYGVALELYDKGVKKTKFRSLQIYKQHIPVRTEICDLCPNACKLKVAEINGEVEAYGFLCGRDYNTQRYVNYNTSGFDLIRTYRRTFFYRPKNKKEKKVIGIPYNLYLLEEMPLWRKFFDLLGIPTITSEKIENPIKDGKNISRAEFCAPIAAMHAHVDYLVKQKADFIFLPVYLEEKTENKQIRREYCYYTQFIPSIISTNLKFKNVKIISPLIRSRQGEVASMLDLYLHLKKAGFKYSLLTITKAYETAKKFYQQLEEKWRKLLDKYYKDDGKIKVVFLGRPYNVLAPTMNNNIPDIFAKNGIKTFYQTMFETTEKDYEEIKYLLEVIKWKYASQILSVAAKVAKTPGLYPVYITSFKCSPDSFTLEYFKMIMETYKKPYLILQLDEHDSSVGYETRIEAAIRSFTNHYNLSKVENKEQVECSSKNVFKTPKEIGNRTILLPEWDPYISPLLKGTLKNAGFNALALSDTQTSIIRSTVLNTGQCIPLSIIIQNVIDLMVNNKLNPEEYVVWLVDSNLACNFSMYPYYLKKVLKDKKYVYPGLEKIAVYLGDLSFIEFGFNTAVNAFLSYMFGGYIRKVATKIRPYEINKGQTDYVVKKSLQLLENVFATGASKEAALAKIIADFKNIPIKKEPRPKVAIFGDLYVRDNDTLNQDIIRFMERNGAEVITTPYSEYLKLIINPYFTRRFREGFFLDAATVKFMNYLIPLVEQKYYKYFYEILKEPLPKPLKNVGEKLKKFNIKRLHFGESFDNALKVLYLSEHYPDIDFFVQLNPSYCAAALITEAMAEKIQQITGKPVITIEYDATSSFKNDQVIPFIKYAKEKLKEKHLEKIR